MARPTNDRIMGILLIGLALLGLLWLRCGWLQVLGGSRYAAYAVAQQQSTNIIRARRGSLVDRVGRPLAVSVPVPSVFANARSIDAKRQVAEQVGSLIGRDPGMIRERLERDKQFVWIARHVSRDLQPELASLHGEGIGTIEESKRLYPQGALAGHALGFVNVDEQGLEGLELAFNGVLRGEDGWRTTMRDAKGSQILGPSTIQADPVNGLDMVLTIDSVVQQVVEETLDWGMAKYHANGGSIIVMDPANGALLAVANAPAYDPNEPAASPMEARRNRAVTDMFEPGSVFKVVTASALFEEKRITPDEPIFCEHRSFRTPGGHILHDHTSHGILPFRDVIKYSSNIGTAKAAQRLKPEELYRYIQAFGFGRRTGVELPGEVSGMAKPASRWSKLSPYIIPIGQEIAVTPMQLAVMTAVVANGGSRVRPYLVERIQTTGGRLLRRHRQEAPVRVISRETAALMQTILASVVESGTGQLANVQGLTVAGKTGTAQKLEPTGRYSHSRYVASFVGFGPVPDSRFVIVVLMDEPHPLYFGGVVSAPMFKRIVERLAGYWELERAMPREVAKLP